MSNDPFTFTPEERGFERVSDDDSDALYATNESNDATGNVARVEFAARGNDMVGYRAQRLKLDSDGKITGKETFGRRKDTRDEAVEGVEAMVRNRTAANFGGFEIGEFNVGKESDIDLARRAHLSRSQEAQASDAAKRAPVTTDASRYASQPGELDYPAVDTPTTDPNVLPKDLRQRQRPTTTEPPEQPQIRSGVTPMVEDESAAGFSDVYGTVGQELRSTAAGRGPQPVNVGQERADSMVADGLGGVALDRNTGGYRETDRPDEETQPPAEALDRQGRELEAEQRERAAEQAGVLQPDRSQSGSNLFDIAASTVEDVFSEDEKDRLQDEFETATNQFDEIGTDDASDFLDEAAFRKAQLPSLETGDTLATNTTNTLLSARRAER